MIVVSNCLGGIDAVSAGTSDVTNSQGNPECPTATSRCKYDRYMSLSRREKFILKSQMIEVLDNDQDWNTRRTNLLLTEFGCEPLNDRDNDRSFEDSIKNLCDTDLLDVYSLVTGVEPDLARSSIEGADSPLWKPDYVRVFLSHSAQHKDFAQEIAAELAVSGVHAFVAHETIEYEIPWQEQIEDALRSMQAFVAVADPGFLDSPWCQQELGWALGRGIPKYLVRFRTDPTGFVSRTQWPQAAELNSRDVAQVILRWVSRIPEFSDQIIDGLLAALRSAGNYIDAGATAKRIATMDTLTQDQWTTLARIYWLNDQVGGAGLVRNALQPYYQSQGQSWPPPKPAPFSPDSD